MIQPKAPAVSLSKLTPVDPRQIWPNEAADFTPWLAQNISELSAALGIDIEVKETEKKVGGYVLDIYAVDKDAPDTVIIIENQLDKTDHDHLGQLMAYAAGLDAKVVVWIAPEIRDEHRTTIEWLNQKTTEAVKFYLVQVEVIRIGDSLPAVRFEVKVAPSEFERELESIKPKSHSVGPKPKQIVWSDSPTTPVGVSTWTEIFQKALERAVQEGRDIKDLPVKSSSVAADLRTKVTVQMAGQPIYVDSNAGSIELRRRTQKVLIAMNKPSKFMRIECEDGSIFELPQ